MQGKKALFRFFSAFPPSRQWAYIASQAPGGRGEAVKCTIKKTFLEHPSFLEFGNVCHTLSVRLFVLVEAMTPGLNFTFAALVWQVALGHNNVE